jgi:hypothetical protein
MRVERAEYLTERLLSGLLARRAVAARRARQVGARLYLEDGAQ